MYLSYAFLLLFLLVFAFFKNNQNKNRAFVSSIFVI